MQIKAPILNKIYLTSACGIGDLKSKQFNGYIYTTDDGLVLNGDVIRWGMDVGDTCMIMVTKSPNDGEIAKLFNKIAKKLTNEDKQGLSFRPKETNYNYGGD